MKIRGKIYVSTLVITISVIGMLIFMQACKIGAGNIGYVTIISHNLDKAVFQQYADSVLQLYGYQVPENLQNYALKYDFFQVNNFYFNDKPEAIYRLKYSNFLYNISIYYPENSKTINSESSLSIKEKRVIQQRVIEKFLKPIEAMALSDGLSPREVYVDDNCKSVVKCE